MNDFRDADAIEGYRKEIERLREENRFLRQSSEAFGELAERLRAELEHARGAAGDPGPGDPR